MIPERRKMKDIFEEENDQHTAELFIESLNREFVKTRIEIKPKEVDEIPEEIEIDEIPKCKNESIPTDNDNVVDSSIIVEKSNSGICLNCTAIFVSFLLGVLAIRSLAVSAGSFSVEMESMIINNQKPLLSIQEETIPVLLELPSEGVFSISKILIKCLGLKTSSYNDRLVESYKVNLMRYHALRQSHVNI